jgi:hypothetical protein
MSYAPNTAGLMRELGIYVGRVLKGEAVRVAGDTAEEV